MPGRDDGVWPVTVPTVTAPASVQIMSAPIRLCGFSLQATDAAGLQGSGQVTSPAAGGVIAQMAAVPAGEYQINWLVILSGTVGAGDADNFGLFVGAAQVATSANLGAAGSYPQVPVQVVVPAGGAAIQIRAVAIGTVGAVYTASLSTTAAAPSEGQLLDGAQVVAQIGMNTEPSQTVWFDAEGVYVSGPLTIKANTGTMSGVVYVTDFHAHRGRLNWRKSWRAMMGGSPAGASG